MLSAMIMNLDNPLFSSHTLYRAPCTVHREPFLSMYLDHYGLKRQPFNLSSVRAFLWAGAKHRAALDTLKEGILEDQGFVLLTGDVGTGKSTLVEAFPSHPAAGCPGNHSVHRPPAGGGRHEAEPLHPARRHASPHADRRLPADH